MAQLNTERHRAPELCNVIEKIDSIYFFDVHAMSLLIFTGSFFIRSFCKQVLLYGGDCDLYHINARINDDLNSKIVYFKDSEHRISMTAELTGTASKLLYLSVPQSDKQKAEALVQQWEDVEKTECKQRQQQKFNLYLRKLQFQQFTPISLLTHYPN